MSGKLVFTDEFTITLTEKCNFTCLHCSRDCAPTGEDMLLEQATSAINEFYSTHTVSGSKHISFSGGEVTLTFDNLLKCIKLANSLGMETNLNTNAWWVKKAKEYSFKFKKAGLSMVQISVDIYHLKNNSWENIKTVCDSLREIGLSVNFNIVSRVKHDNDNARPILDELSEYIPENDILDYFCKFGYLDSLVVNISNYSHVGRAARNFTAYEQRAFTVPGHPAPKGIYVELLPGYRFSLNCPWTLPFSVYHYEKGDLFDLALRIEAINEKRCAKAQLYMVNSCIACNWVMNQIVYRPEKELL